MGQGQQVDCGPNKTKTLNILTIFFEDTMHAQNLTVAKCATLITGHVVRGT